MTCNTESGGGRDPANIKYIITFILISLLASVCLLARLAVAMDPSAKRARTNVAPLHFLPPVIPDSYCRYLPEIIREINLVIALSENYEISINPSLGPSNLYPIIRPDAFFRFLSSPINFPFLSFIRV